MANYYEYSVLDVTDIEKVGVGNGDINGSERICIALEGRQINPNLAPDTREANWIALSLDCARHLYELLDQTFGVRSRNAEKD